VDRAEFSGRLHLASGEREIVVGWDAGQPVTATSDHAVDRMTEMMLREGRLTAEQAARVARQVEDTKRRVGAVLVDLGLLRTGDLFPLVRRHYESIVQRALSTETGTYRLEAGPLPVDERIRLVRSAPALLLEGVRTAISVRALRVGTGGPDTVLRPSAEDVRELLLEAGLGPAEQRLAAFVDGRRSLRDIQTASGASEEETLRLAFALDVLGAVERRAPEPAPASRVRQRVVTQDQEGDRARVLARYALVREGDYFQLLGVGRNATSADVRRAYETLRREFAPESFDASISAELAPELAAIAEVFDEGLRVLGNDDVRRRYADHLAAEV